MDITPRSEDEIFSELEQLCASAGYIHVFAALVVQNTFVAFAEGLKGEDFHKTFEKDHLVRTELCTLFGLMVKHPIDYSILTMEQMSELGTCTLQLLEELHASLGGPPLTPPADGNLENFQGIDFSLGSALREPIFYTGESAYSFQYRDIAPVKYANDDPWMQANRGFTIAQAACVGKAVLALEQERLMTLYNSLRSGIPDDFTFLPGFTFTPDELLEGSGESKATIISVLDSFSIRNGDTNATFKTLNDFNIVNAQPILCKEPGTYILFQAYSFYEALYESPFYWMLQDPAYKDVALGHRGSFTEEFSANCLSRVFAKKYVHGNVTIQENAATTLGEIDNLVLFGNRAVLIQTKSKRLTIAARKGNDGAIQEDFSASVADAYKQAIDCAKHLLRRDKPVFDKDGKKIVIPKLKKIYLLCIVSDHYPALNFQAGQFLAPQISEEIPAPLITDIFALDVMTEMLRSPLHFLGYIDRRTAYGDKIYAGNELTILGYHLTRNLWLPKETDVLYMHDDLASGLDAAMAVRRAGVPGDDTPRGILTVGKGTAFERLLAQLDHDPRGNLVDLGFRLLEMSEESATQLSQGLEHVTRQARKTGSHHDFTMGSSDRGISIHCGFRSLSDGMDILARHVLSKKYQMKAPVWFGISVHPADGSLLYGYNAEFEWKEDARLEKAVSGLSLASNAKFVDGRLQKRKVGRNDLCPCGSGKKYKKCHLNK